MILSFSSYRTSKGKLLRMLKPMRGEQFANKINPIIAEKRDISEDQAKQKQYLQSNEVIAFLEAIGEPLNNYAKVLDVGSHRMNKTRLRLLFPTLSAPEFSKVINKTISQCRGIPLDGATRKRYLLPTEIMTFLEMIGEVVPG